MSRHNHLKRLAAVTLATTLSLLTAASISHAQSTASQKATQTAKPFSLPGVVYPRGKPPCTCRAAGARHPLGTTLCIKFADRRELARCDLEANNTNWVRTGKSCAAPST